MERLPERYRLLRPYIEGKKILDLGCIDHDWRRSLQENWIHNFIVKWAKEVQGLDILKEDVQKLAELGYYIKYGNAENFDLGTQFDAIFAGELLEHLEDFRGFFESCKKHMKRDSKLIITTPNCFGLRYLFWHLLNRPHGNPEHTCWFDERTLGHLLDKHDFKIDSIKYVSLDREFVKGIKAIILRLLEKIPKSSPILFLITSKKESTQSS